MLKTPLQKHPHLLAFGIFVGFSLLLLLPHLITRGMVTGADLIFHYNRFYDAAMQLKEGNFSPFISLYGYQQSGRMVNALYGPLFAYLQGGLVLLSGSWFRYQILSNLLLGVLSSSSLYGLMRVLKVRYRYAILFSLFFVTTYSIQYWWATQGFTSWGVALFPLCLIPAVRFLQTKTVPVLWMAGAVSLMLQVHMLSTLFLVLAYACLFLLGWLPARDKWRLLGQVLLSVGIFLVLTVNIWLPLVHVNLENTLVPPFVNKKFVSNTVTWSKTLFLYYPYALPAVFLAYLWLTLKQWKTHTLAVAGLSLTYVLFFVLSTNLFPWQLLAGKGITLVELIQFPFRFFLYATALVLAVLAWQVGNLSQKAQKVVTSLSGLALLVGLVFTWQESVKEIRTHYYSDSFLSKRIHTTLYATSDELRQSFHTGDLSAFIRFAQKSTPDYVPDLSLRTSPTTNEESDNTYDTYCDQVILPNNAFVKEVAGKDLLVSWDVAAAGETSLPVIVYRGSLLVLNGQELERSAVKLSSIGVPTVVSQPGHNQLRLSYPTPWWFQPIMGITLTGWLIWLLSVGRLSLQKGLRGEVR